MTKDLPKTIRNAKISLVYFRQNPNKEIRTRMEEALNEIEKLPSKKNRVDKCISRVSIICEEAVEALGFDAFSHPFVKNFLSLLIHRANSRSLPSAERRVYKNKASSILGKVFQSPRTSIIRGPDGLESLYNSRWTPTVGGSRWKTRPLWTGWMSPKRWGGSSVQVVAKW